MSSQAATRAIIIAAGRGRRLMPYTDRMPKCLVPVDHRTILGIQLDALRAHGVRDVVIIRGYLGDVLDARRGELGDGIRFVENADWERNMWWEDRSGGDPKKWQANTGNGWAQNHVLPIIPDPKKTCGTETSEVVRQGLRVWRTAFVQAAAGTPSRFTKGERRAQSDWM